MYELKINNSTLKIIKGDITNQNTDAIVNAANTRLTPGGGVSGAIHKAAGPSLWQECKKLNGCKTGEAKITKGYQLKASYVIHTVGPVYSGSANDEKNLTNSYTNSLELAYKHNLKSISFPAISAGIFGYPLKEAAKVALESAYKWLQKIETQMLVQFVLYDDNSFNVFKEVLTSIKK